MTKRERIEALEHEVLALKAQVQVISDLLNHPGGLIPTPMPNMGTMNVPATLTPPVNLPSIVHADGPCPFYLLDTDGSRTKCTLPPGHGGGHSFEKQP